MDTLAPLGRRMFALAIIACGIQQYLVGDFVPGRPPDWPADLAGRLVWAYGSGAVLIAAGAAILLQKRAREAAMLIATLIAAWALLRNIPLALADTQFGGAWTNLGKALALAGGALGVAGELAEDEARRESRRVIGGPSRLLLLIGRWSLGIYLVDSGIQHFLFTAFVMTLVPAWLPAANVWTYLGGTALIAGGLGLLVPRTARLAAAMSGLMIGIWFVMLHLPRALAALPPQRRNEWTAVFEALAFSGIALALTASRRPRSNFIGRR